MQSKFVRGGLLAAVSVLALAISAPAPVIAQQVSAAAAAADLAAKGVWDPDTAYVVDDIVVARGSTWRAIKANTGRVPGSTSPNNKKYWELFARGFNPTGGWSGVATYQPDDLVTRNGSTWRAKKTNTNIAPVAGNTWEQFAAVGAAGPNTGIGDGTQLAPSISFSGDADTGIFHLSAGKMALVQNGALMLHTFGANNSGFGEAALQSNSSGTDNTAVGNAAMYPNSSGSNNTAVGSLALASNTTGSRNTGIGSSALGANDSGANNTAVGYQSLQNSLTADNTAVGYQALKAQAGVGNSNTAVGAAALAANTNGSTNVAVGQLALTANLAGSANTAFGYAALLGNTNGGSNVAVGGGALASSTGGNNNVSLGYNSLGSLNGGGDNIAIGKDAGNTLTSGNNNIFIGNAGQTTESDTIRIGTTQAATFIAGIRGTTTANNTAVPVLVDAFGQLGTVNSSRRYKYDIETMADVPEMLGKLRPVTFRYKKAQDGGAHPLQYGLIAEEVADVFPDLTVFNKDGSAETVKYHLLPSFLLAGYQAQQKTIEALTERDRHHSEKIEAQSDEIAALKARLAAIEALLPRVTRTAAQ